MKRIDVPASLNEAGVPFRFHVGEPDAGAHPLEQQAAWLRREHGTAMPDDIMIRFRMLADIADRNALSLEELAARFWAGLADDDRLDGPVQQPSEEYQFERSGKLIEMTEPMLREADTEGSAVIVLYRGTTAEGEDYWLYIAVKPSKYGEWMQAVNEHRPVRFADYGEILSYGYSKTVPPEIREEMERDYGCRENYVEWVAQEVAAARTAFLSRQVESIVEDVLSESGREDGAGPEPRP